MDSDATPTPHESLRDHAAHHSRLIASISELEHVPAALKHQSSLLVDIRNQLEQSKARLQTLSDKTKKERQEHECLRESTARRLAHKLTGRKEQFEAMTIREEREFVEALENENVERDTCDMLISMVKDAEREKEDLASKMARYEALQKELCDLYLHVFDGPSEEFPEADRLKYQVHTVQSLHRQIQDTLETECRVSELLAKAEQAINACRETIQGPLKNIPGCDPYDRNLDILNTGPTMPEQDVLWRAQLSATTANDLTQEAKSLSPFVQLGDSLFAAITNLRSLDIMLLSHRPTEYRRTLSLAADRLQQMHNSVRKEREAAQRRANNAGTQLIEVDQTLEEAKLALTSYRAELLQGICREMEHSSTSDHPPSYHAISAPTEAFTAEAPPVPIPITPAQTQSPRPTAASVPVAGWGSRNPYATTLATRSRPPSYDEN